MSTVRRGRGSQPGTTPARPRVGDILRDGSAKAAREAAVTQTGIDPMRDGLVLAAAAAFKWAAEGRSALEPLALQLEAILRAAQPALQLPENSGARALLEGLFNDAARLRASVLEQGEALRARAEYVALLPQASRGRPRDTDGCAFAATLTWLWARAEREPLTPASLALIARSVDVEKAKGEAVLGHPVRRWKHLLREAHAAVDGNAWTDLSPVTAPIHMLIAAYGPTETDVINRLLSRSFLKEVRGRAKPGGQDSGPA